MKLIANGYSASAFISCPLNEAPKAIVYIGDAKNPNDYACYSSQIAPIEITAGWLRGFVSGVNAEKEHLESVQSPPRKSLERITELFCDLIADLAPNAVSQFLNLHDGAVDGTNEIVITADLDAAALDTKLRAALRAGGFELPERNIRFAGHNSTPVDGLDTATVDRKEAIQQ